MEKTYQRINWENEPSTVTPLNEDNLNRIDYAVDVIDTRVVELGSYRDDAMQSAESARENAILSQSYAVGGTNERVGENVDNAKYYKEQAETASRNVESAVVEVNTAVSSATTSARNAKESEDNSKISETNAKDSENKAKASENNAKVSEDNAKTSEDNAKTSEEQCNSASEIAQNAVTSISSYMETIETAVESASASADRAQEIADSIDYDYTNMRNKPSINGHELVGNLTTEDLDISAEPEGYSELVETVETHTTEISTLSENVIALNDDLMDIVSNVSAHDTAIADLTVEQSTQASNISNLDIEVAKKANKSEIPTVNNGTLIIQKNGSNVTTFTANQSGNVTANIITPDGMISDAYQSGKTYTVGEYCIDNNQMWKCKTQCKGQTPAENSYWTKRSIGQEIKQINTDLSDIKGWVDLGALDPRYGVNELDLPTSFSEIYLIVNSNLDNNIVYFTTRILSLNLSAGFKIMSLVQEHLMGGMDAKYQFHQIKSN